jgi:hypothetical protein
MYDIIKTAIAAASVRALDDLAREVWREHGAGHLDDDQAQHLAETIQGRRGTAARALKSVAPALTEMKRYRIQRSPEQRSPDRRASIARRRELAARGSLPPSLALQFTVGEQAFLSIIADEWLAHGVCDRSLNELAARARISRTLAKRTLRLAEALGYISVDRRPRSGRKHLTNLVRIKRAEWLDWLRKGNRKAKAVESCQRAKPDFRGAQNNLPRLQVYKNSGNRATTLPTHSPQPLCPPH